MSLRKIVVVGASGVFGARLAGMVARWPDVALVLAARRREPLVRASGATASIEIALLDRNWPGALSNLSPFAVVDAAGPFQSSDLRLAEAAVASGAHYVDLADGRAFVDHFPSAMSAHVASSTGLWAVTGASSTPALSTAVLDRLTAGWRRIDEVSTAISPGADAPRGPSVVDAIFSWAGRPVRVSETGAWTTRPGWSGSRRLFFPGLGVCRLVALAETPDLDQLPRRYSPTTSGRFEAGLELLLAHYGLLARCGTDRGAMVVHIAADPTGETWSRNFGARCFRSRITPVANDPFAFEETIGPVTLRFHAVGFLDGFSWIFEGWRLGPLPLPAFLAPNVRARTFSHDGVYRFRVLVSHPLVGVICGYTGRLGLK